ncbi:MAG: cytochrome-c oxidase, cbb3-type subunit I [Planctomycetes bacterium]|nr:cytochrome-c oxidase, cbb3-type subunit I [Planctomycetota bacterium]
MTSTTSSVTVPVTYDDKSVRGFIFFSVFWGLIGMLVGLLAALQLSFPGLNFDLPWLTFSRIRPLHTNAVVFALVGNMMFAGIYYSTQRLLKTRMASDLLSKVHLWGWQLIVVAAAVTLPLGITQSKEYAELEWPIDLMVVVVWVAFAVNFFWTLAIRNERNIYVAIWFYIATILTVAMLYIVNNLALPIAGTKSYGIFAGGQDALTQWWYGHNAVAFFLTTPILGIMYYFLPKAAERPVYSYRLSIVHFWGLVFIYIWAGPHHLLYTALPVWAQSLGMLFSLMLWAPSWGGMLNGLLTLRGAWHKVRTDPVLKFFVAGVTFYGMSTFEGPLLSIKSVNALGHYTDWIIAHVHGGALGWNGFMAAGMFYWLVPRLFGTQLHSRGLADFHFWIGTFGILLYMVAMWVGGVTHGLMWRAENPDGGLTYPQWAEVIEAVLPMYMLRSIGGTLYLLGWGLMIYNLLATVRGRQPVAVTVTVPKLESTALPSSARLIFSTPIAISVLGCVAGVLFGLGNLALSTVMLVFLLMLVVWAGFLMYHSTGTGKHVWHQMIEGRPLAFSILTMLAVMVGGIVQLVPGLVLEKKVPLTASGEYAVAPYTPLELEGRDVYVREGCYVCHSQMIRPFRSEFLRYGEPSRLEESMWDHPFQWGSKRTGPDLARVGGKYGDDWHYRHMLNPRDLVGASNMPAYPWLRDAKVDTARTSTKLAAMRRLGVPYKAEEIQGAAGALLEQGRRIAEGLAAKGLPLAADSELTALIAFLQRLGKNAVGQN